MLLPMRSKPGRDTALHRPDQLRALASPVRQEIVDVLDSGGPIGVAAIAHALGRPPDALYYHVRHLLRVGLLVSAGRRRTRGREEELFDVAARPVALARRPDARHRQAVHGIVAAMLRLTARQHAAASRRAETDQAIESRALWGSRVSGWLTPDDVDRIVGLLHRINATIRRRRRRGGGRLHAFTFVLTPVVTARRRTPSRGPA